MSVTVLLIILNVAASAYAFQRPGFFSRWAHRPWDVQRFGQYERWLSSGFIHADWLHLGINMFVLWQFGSAVEKTFIELSGYFTGSVRFVTIYLIVVVASSIPSYFKHRHDPYYASVGASGGVSGILFGYVLFRPLNLLYLYGIIPIYGIVAAVAYVLYSSWASRRGGDRINHDAHLYGALAGLLLTILFYPKSVLYFLRAMGLLS